MPLIIDTVSRTGTLTQAINDLMASGGPRALSIRAIGRSGRVSPSSIIHHYGHLDHLVRVAAHWTSRARQESVALRSEEGMLALLPRTDDDVVDARVLLAWAEVWRSNPAVELTWRDHRRDERAQLARIMGYELTTDELDTTIALIEGLTVAVCAPLEPMRPARARALLAAWQARFQPAAAARNDAIMASGSSAE